MTNKNILFSFDDMSSKDKATKQSIRYFNRAGATVASSDVDAKIKKSSGISYREMLMTFADSQTVKFKVKESGDIYQVLINGRLTPIKNQDDHVKAVSEIVKHLDSGRTKFQAKMAKAKVKLPPRVRTAAPNMIKALTEKRDNLKVAIEAVNDEIEALAA